MKYLFVASLAYLLGRLVEDLFGRDGWEGAFAHWSFVAAFWTFIASVLYFLARGMAQ